MSKPAISDLIARSAYFKAKLSAFRSRGRVGFSGLIGASKSAMAAALAEQFPNLLIITASSSTAEKVKSEIEFLAGRPAHVFPVPELAGERLEILGRWQAGEKLCVVAPVKAVLAKTTKPGRLKEKSLALAVGMQFSLEGLIARLINLGFKRFDIVGERGEFSVRGGIIDVFPLNSDWPVRLELAEDRLESLRSFDPYSQRSREKLGGVSVLPAQEEAAVPVFEYLPAGAPIVAYESLEISRLGEDLPTNIALSSLLEPGESEVIAAPPNYFGRFSEIPETTLIVSRHAERLKEELPGKNIQTGELDGGFVFEGMELITDHELFGEIASARKAKPPAREGVADELLSDLKIGDYVVHENYGIGIFRGMQSLEIEGIRQEYLLVEYAEGDKLYVPPPMIGLVEKYSSGAETRPRLSRLGTKAWLKTRGRVKESLRELTQELLALYAAREQAERQSFPPDDVWQKELEATFPFDETPDQAKVITDVKKDMEASRPMDRLVCGDVGYGKTEVAIRAAAKAAAGGRQIALLAPTTILVEQHYNNFKQRFKNTPFVIEMLSRFRPPKEQKEVVKLLASGGVDIVIGTHRLLSKDIKFKDLGLLIVDEEQKFGVTHKEKIKKFRQAVDVLTLSATPIPRTLYFSLSGLRAFSQISTPPVDRSPIRTYVVPYSDQVIREAILREIDRGGQVYFVHNFVESIAGVASKLMKLVPEARVTVGHGQMQEKELERTMLDFLERKYDVLVCTSIIESGLDIPNVNTILIDRAERFGLSQLYQIRGRVGRSAARAYAYLFYQPARSMSDEAVERLKAIQEFTALGSGYKLAMRDLEIRGAGNLLGAEQSGHIYEVGFDLYCELLEEAVKEVRGEQVVSPREVDIDLKIEASLPPSYVTDDRQRIALYRRMNLIVAQEGIGELRKELEDRFGRLPAQVETLLRIIQLKVRSLESGVRSIKEKDGSIRIEWVSKKIKELRPGREDKLKLLMRSIAG